MTRYTDMLRALPVALTVGLSMCVPLQQAAGQLRTEAGVIPAEGGRRVSELNVSIAVFDPGVPADSSSHGRLQVFPKIRRVEALLLPFML